MKNGIMIRNAEKEDVRQISEILVEDWQKAYRGIMDDDFLDSITQILNKGGNSTQKREGFNGNLWETLGYNK